MSDSILQRVRSEGYDEGWRQAGQICHDDAYDNGRLDGQQQEARYHFNWWLFGLFCGAPIGFLTGYFS